MVCPNRPTAFGTSVGAPWKTPAAAHGAAQIGGTRALSHGTGSITVRESEHYCRSARIAEYFRAQS